MVGLTALTVLTGDARLALTLPGVDVTLPIGGTQSMAVTPEKKHKIFLGKEEQCVSNILSKAAWQGQLVGMLRVATESLAFRPFL